MPETILTCFIGLALLAAASHRLRQEAGLPAPRTKWLLRGVGLALVAAALLPAAMPVPGERLVRWLGALSVAGLALVLLLSVRPAATLAPVRWAVRRIDTKLQRR